MCTTPCDLTIDLTMLIPLIERGIDHTGQTIRATPPCIALEGQPYAGKSTAIATFRTLGYGTIREYSEYQRFAASDHFVSQTEDQEKEAFLEFVAIERQRFEEYNALQSCPLIFLDRSIFTLIAYQYAIAPLSHGRENSLFSWAIETLLVSPVPLLYPEHIVYLDIPLTLAKHRQTIARDHLPTFFLNALFYTRFRFFFQTLQILKPSWITMLDSSGQKQETTRQIQERIRTLSFSTACRR